MVSVGRWRVGVETDAAVNRCVLHSSSQSTPAVMLVSTVVHMHAIKETSLIHRETAGGASGTLVAAGGSPPQRGRLRPTSLFRTAMNS